MLLYNAKPSGAPATPRSAAAVAQDALVTCMLMTDHFNATTENVSRLPRPRC